MILVRSLVALAALAAIVPAQTVLRTWTLPGRPQFVGDLDNDDVDDFVILDATTLTLTLHSTRAATVLGQIVIPPPAIYITGPYDAGDVNGDGRDDLLVAFGTNSSGGLSILSPTGATLHHFVLFPYQVYVGTLHLWFGRLGDLTGDGRAEFLLADPLATVGGMANAGRIDVINGATGTVLRSHPGTQPDDGFGLVQTFDDIDGDGQRDFLATGALSTPRMHSGATGQLLYPFSISPRFLRALGDITGDGAEEYAVGTGGGKGSGGSGFIVYSGANGAPFWNHSTAYGQLGYVWLNEPVGDLDGDGHDEISLAGSLVSLQISGTIAAGRDRSVLFEQSSSHMRFAGSPGDVDGDGVRDVWFMNGHPTSPLVQVISGIAPGVAPLGHGCPDTTGVTPVIGVGVGARLGRTMSINLSRANPSLGAAVLGVGYSQTTWQGVPLPIDLGPLGLPGCSWYVRGEQLLFLASTSAGGGRRRATHLVQVPVHSQLLGLDLFCQWAVFDPPANGFSAAVSRAMRTRVVP